MKKLLLSLLTLLFCSSLTLVQATDYYVAHNGVMSDNMWNASGDQMSQVGTSSIYAITFNNVKTEFVQFKVTEGSWSVNYGSSNKDQSLSNITLSGSDNIEFTLSSQSNVTIYFNSSDKKVYARTGSLESYTFSSGTTIYYDFTTYNKGINLFDNNWKSDASSVIAYPLSSDWTVTYGVTLFKSEASGWNFVTCSTIPTTNRRTKYAG